MIRSKAYCFTINNDTYDDMDDVLALHAQYFCFGFETGEQGTPHIQGYVMFYRRYTLKKVKKFLKRAHLEKAKGSPQQNIKYCSKDSDFYEFGDRPSQGLASWEKIEEAFSDPTANPNMIRLYGRTYDRIKQETLKKMKINTKFYVINPINDAIGELYEYFGVPMDDDWVFITDMTQLSYYDNPKNIVLYQDYYSKEFSLYPRGVPILYKHGYEMRVVRPERFVVVTSTPSQYHLYKDIK